jgi:hypothetical protein
MCARLFFFLIALTLTGSALAREQVPQQLAEMALGQTPPRNYLDPRSQVEGQSPRTTAGATEVAASAMWLALMPALHKSGSQVHVVLYRERVAEIIFVVESIAFSRAHSSLTARFGKGRMTDTRAPPMDKSCPQDSLQSWTSEGRSLFLIAEAKSRSVTVVLRDEDLHNKMDRDPKVYKEPELCLEL